MPRQISAWTKIKSILRDSTRPIKLLAIVASLLGVIGVCMEPSHDPHDDLSFLIQMMPWYIWVIFLSFHAICRIIELFIVPADRFATIVNEIATYTGPIIGIWTWSIVMTGSMIMTPIDGMSMLVLIPMALEVWILYRTIDDKINGRFERRT